MPGVNGRFMRGVADTEPDDGIGRNFRQVFLGHIEAHFPTVRRLDLEERRIRGGQITGIDKTLGDNPLNRAGDRIIVQPCLQLLLLPGQGLDLTLDRLTGQSGGL